MGILKSLTAGLIAASVAVSAMAQEKWQQGQHYQQLDNPVTASSMDDGIEVVEVFWYGCGYCNEFEPIVQAWKKDLSDRVNFVLLPAPMSRSSEAHAYAFYASEALGTRDKTHEALYQALAVDKKPLNSASELAEYLAEHGVDREAFIEAYESFGVKARVQRARSVLRGARVSGTPTLLVAGKYKTSPAMAGGYEEALEVVDYLLEKEVAARAE